MQKTKRLAGTDQSYNSYTFLKPKPTSIVWSRLASNPRRGRFALQAVVLAQRWENISYRLCLSCRQSYLRHLYPCLCLGRPWEAATAPSVGLRPRGAAGREAPRQAPVTAYSASQQALLAAKQIFAPVFAHSSAAESCLVVEARFDAAQLASAPFASALYSRPSRADCSKVAHFSSIHEDHFPGRRHLSTDPGPAKHRQRQALDDRPFPVCSRCEQRSADRHWQVACPAHRQHWEARLAEALCGSCLALRMWHLPIQCLGLDDHLDPPCSSCENLFPYRHGSRARPARQQYWDLRLVRTLSGYCLARRRLQEWMPQVIRWNGYRDPPSHSGDLSPGPAWRCQDVRVWEFD